ncbi:MAG: FAD-binding oxidoreductase [Actinomycetota bacterium]|nr:FAD-binding oxidoreductase [Actinomycetota bacterium]
MTPAVLADFAAALADPIRLQTGVTDRLKMAHDASHYALTPQAVAVPLDALEVGRLFAASARSQVPLTFRSGGTSLSGQGGTTGVLVDTRRHFRDIEVLDAGARVRVGPGATVRQVNARLARHGRKLGPDPASEVACTLGGVVANNSSGMACGTQANTYATLDSLVVVLPSGTVVDSGAADADERLRALEPQLHEGLARLRDRVRGNPDSVRRVEAQFAMKNTMGYGVNAFLDHTRPVDILAHLVVGSEGTLAFIASVVLHSVPVLPHAMTGLLVFDDLAGATGALPALLETAPATLELMDAASLRVGQADPAASAVLRRIRVERHAALLVEYQADTLEGVVALTQAAAPTLARLVPNAPAGLTADPVERASLWHTRKGLYATVAEARPAGTTALLEDVVVPVPALLPTCESLIGLFERHGYDDAVIFGHAKDGNIHFMLTERLGGSDSDRLQHFTDDMVDLVLGAGGSLKAEHGTGRMMAPYVRRQYGEELYDVMWQVKRLCDPDGILNPGVLLTDDPQGHLRYLKSAPTVEAEVDRCVECGYCEPVCPSRDLTTTPRQRIALRREMALARERGDMATLAELEADYDYQAVDTCAVDAMCQTACPVHINTGDLMKRLRTERAGPLVQRGWASAARHWSGVTQTGSAALTTTKALPAAAVSGPNRLARRVLGDDVVPLWSPDLPGGGRRRRAGGVLTPRTPSRLEVVAFSACVGSIFGASTDGGGVGPALERLCSSAGVTLRHPDDLPSLCCGTPWRSKGMTQGAREMERRVLESLWQATEGGRLDVVCDASSCTEGLRESVARAVAEPGSPYGELRVIDAVTFVARSVLPHLPAVRKIASLALHPTCSSTRLGIDGDLRAVAAAVAQDVFVPDSWGCCGFAGDRGMLHPELTASATAAQAAEVVAAGAGAHASSNRTCELGMSRATGQDYRHVLELLADAL